MLKKEWMPLLLTVIAWGNAGLVMAQKNFKPGYVVTVAGDTMRGEIEDRLWQQNPETVQFRMGGQLQSFDKQQLLAFGIDQGSQFRKAGVHYYPGTLNPVSAGFDYPSSQQEDTVLLRVLESGTYSLFGLSTKERPVFFLTGPDNGGYRELVYRVRVRNGQFEQDETYKNFLIARAFDAGVYNQVENRIRNARYTEENLFDIVAALNKRTKAERKGAAAAQGSMLRADLGGGVNITGFRSSGSSADAMTSASFQTSVRPMLLAGIALSNRRGVPLDVLVRTGFTQLSVNGTATNGLQSISSSLNYIPIQLSVLFYSSKHKSNRLFFGPAVNYNLALGNPKGTTTFYGSGSPVEDPNAPIYLSNQGYAGILTGYHFGPHRLEAWLGFSSDIIPSRFLHLNATSVAVQYVYRLKGK